MLQGRKSAMSRLFDFIARRTSYGFAFIPFVALSGYFAASYAFFIVYFSVEHFTPDAIRAFALTLAGMLFLVTALHAYGFGLFERSGLRAGLRLPRTINTFYRSIQRGDRMGVRELETLLEGLARFPRYHMLVAVVIALAVTIPSLGVEYAFSRSPRHLWSGFAGGVIAAVLYCYFCYVITETLSAELRSLCRRELSRKGAGVPSVHGIGVQGKIGFAVAIVFFSMGMLIYFLWFCDATLTLTAGFLVTTFLTVVVLVFLYFRSVKAAFDEILRATRSLSRGGGELLHLGNNEKELVEFAVHFNRSIQEIITLRRDLEAQVEARTRDLSVKAGELEQANERLKGLDRLKSRFLSSVSHELRTPLTAIQGFVRLVRRDFTRAVAPGISGDRKVLAKAERIERNLDIIQDEGDRLTRLINDVLDLARIESGRMEWHDEDLDMGPCVERAVRVMEGSVERRDGVELGFAVAGPLPPVRADRDRIMQVLVNLIGNALKFTTAGEVRVKASAGGEGAVRVSVEDTGSGIDPGDAERIFERFHQGEASADRPKGTGLGLAICREIVLHYGGWIRAEPRKDGGSRFVFFIPPAAGAAERDTR
jgi:signal transduction histidine kinase